MHIRGQMHLRLARLNVRPAAFAWVMDDIQHKSLNTLWECNWPWLIGETHASNVTSSPRGFNAGQQRIHGYLHNDFPLESNSCWCINDYAMRNAHIGLASRR